MAVNGNDACYVFACFFFGILVLSMQHSCHVLHAFCFYCWPSPGTVACLLFALHVCHASTVTAAFRYPLCFFLGWLLTRTVPVMSLLVFFFGTLVASLRHSGFCIPWVLACPGFFSYRLFFPFWLDLITCNRVSFGGSVCCPVLAHFFFNWTFLHACLKSCHRYHQCTGLLHEVASGNGQLGVMSRYVTLRHVMPCLAAMPGSSWIPPLR